MTLLITDKVYYFHYLMAEIAAYLLKPIDVDDFVDTSYNSLTKKSMALLPMAPQKIERLVRGCMKSTPRCKHTALIPLSPP